jgi:hypothetical protein
MDELIKALMQEISQEAAGIEVEAEKITFEVTEDFLNGSYLP